MRVLICGGGVIGASIAYYLGLRGIESVVIERSGIACAASGKSGGFLALDWCDGSAMGRLARRSFELHAELADAGLGDWGYRRLDTLGVACRSGGAADAYRRFDAPTWLGDVAAVYAELGSERSTAQVHPKQFTDAMLAAAVDRGAGVQMGTVTGLALSTDGGSVRGALVDGKLVEGDAVVIAMGPWSVLACRWLPLPAVHGLKGHSIVVRPEAPLSRHALFVDLEEADGESHAPEVFPRPDGTVYVCGLSGETALPVDPDRVEPDAHAGERLQALAGLFSPALGAGTVVATQACYRPIASDALPLMGQVGGIDGAYVATGHNCWGILNAPASGEAMAELIADGAARSTDLTPFDPARLPVLAADAVATA